MPWYNCCVSPADGPAASAESLVNPPVRIAELLETFERVGLVETAAKLRPLLDR